jgi:hypothetical protein
MSAAVSRTSAAAARARESRAGRTAGLPADSPDGLPGGLDPRRAQAVAAGPADDSAPPEAGAHRASGRRWRLRWRAGLHRGDRGVGD